jgi:hypothetical protein
VHAPAHAAPMAAPSADPVVALSAAFHARGFEVLTEVADLGIALAAHQQDGKRIIALRVGEATPAAVQEANAKVQELEAHAGLLLADTFAPGAWLEAAGTKVTLLPAAAAEAIVL